MNTAQASAAERLEFRDREQALAFAARLETQVLALGGSVCVMHVCGTHEQSIARFGLRSLLPRGLDLIMGPGCPVCVTDQPEVDEAVALVRQGVRVATFGDMLRVPGSDGSLADARAAGGRVDVVYGIAQAVQLAGASSDALVFFATGFETTAVTTAAMLQTELPANFSVLSAHKYIPPAMEVVARMPGSRVQGFLAAGHAAAITGAGVFQDFAQRHRLPVVVAGFEPLDILAALCALLAALQAGASSVTNLFPRGVSQDGNRNAQDALWRVMEAVDGRWRGIADVPRGNLRLRDSFGHVDARRRFTIDLGALGGVLPSALQRACRCGDIMAGLCSPKDCKLFGGACTPENPVGACMVSSEGSCRIWHAYGAPQDLREAP